MDFTTIYSRIDNLGYLNILFFNKTSNTALYFDGLDFNYIITVSVQKDYKEISYSERFKGNPFSIEAIRKAWDIYFIKLSNKDIFQLSFSPDNEQHLTIFTRKEHDTSYTPLDISTYEAALKRFEEAEEYHIETK